LGSGLIQVSHICGKDVFSHNTANLSLTAFLRQEKTF